MNDVSFRLEEIKHADSAHCSSSKAQYYQLKSEFDDNQNTPFLGLFPKYQSLVHSTRHILNWFSYSSSKIML